MIQDDVVKKLAQAIATAEGFYMEGSLPNRIHNPGDLEVGDRGYGVLQLKTIYLKADIEADIHDITDGFSALRRQITNMLNGISQVYSPEDSIETLARKWTGNDNPGAWCRIVSEKLVVDPMTKLQELV